jgi:hypothetical protein
MVSSAMSSAMTMQQGSPAGNRAASPDKGDHAGVRAKGGLFARR